MEAKPAKYSKYKEEKSSSDCDVTLSNTMGCQNETSPPPCSEAGANPEGQKEGNKKKQPNKRTVWFVDCCLSCISYGVCCDIFKCLC